MSERDGYEPGVPCWVAGAQPDPGRPRLLHASCSAGRPRRRGELPRLPARAAATSPASARGGEPAAWSTHIWVESADEAAARARDAGGTRASPSRPTSPASAARPSSPTPPAPCSPSGEPDPHRAPSVVNEPGAWAMSALSDARPRGRKAFYGAVFGWETDSFGDR